MRSKATLKQFLLIFLPSVIILSIAIAFIYFTEARNSRKLIKTSEINNIIHLQSMIKSDFKSVTSDLMVLSEDHDLLEFIEEATSLSKHHVAENFLSYSK